MTLLAHRPHAVALDVNETLFDLSALRPRFEAIGLPEHALEWWFAVLLRDGLALAASGGSAPFPTLATQALEEVFSLVGRKASPDLFAELLAGFAELPPHPDVVPGLERLADAGIPAVALTNGSTEVTAGLVRRAGISSLVAHVFSVDTVGHWKPRPEPYQYAASRLGVQPPRLAMVAVHPWDLHGAASAGLVTGWVNRGGRAYPSAFVRPNVEERSLDGVVERLLRLPDR